MPKTVSPAARLCRRWGLRLRYWKRLKGRPLSSRQRFAPSSRVLDSRCVRADLCDLYDFIYHATSTTVHFNPGQLMRAVWGHPGEMRIDLAPVEARLADFGAYWGVRLVLDTLIAGLPLTEWDDQGETLDRGEIERAARMLGGKRPFVLPDEL